MWLDSVEQDLRVLGIQGWRNKAQERSQWKSIVGRSRPVIGCRTNDDDDDSEFVFFSYVRHVALPSYNATGKIIYVTFTSSDSRRKEETQNMSARFPVI
jgi:hypothetical protein